MTVTDAKAYIAGIIGGSNDPKALVRAAEAIARGYTDWQNQRFWTFLLKDTARGFAVAACTATAASASVNAPSSGAFDGVNVGVGVTISSGTATLTAGTTVLSFTRNTDGTIASITLSNSFGGTTNTNATLTFSGDIPTVAGTDEYNLPPDFGGYYSARLIDSVGPKEPLKYIEQRAWDKVTLDQTERGVPYAYSTYNPDSEGGQNFGTSRLRLYRVPDASYTVHVRYFRTFNQTGSNIDVPAQYLYQFLDYCRSIMLSTKRAQDDPVAYAGQVQNAYEAAQQTDEQPNDDDDGDIRLHSPYEQGDVRPIVGNGAFDPFPL